MTSTPKQMTVTDLMTKLARAMESRQYAHQIAGSLVGFEIVPDPEERPDFISMRYQALCEWIEDNASDTTCIPVFRFQQGRGLNMNLIDLASRIADEKGLA